MDVCLHFEAPDREWNDRCIARIADRADEIRRGIEYDFYSGRFGRKWAEARFRVPFHGEFADPAVAPLAADVMKTLIERTHPIVKQIIEEGN